MKIFHRLVIGFIGAAFFLSSKAAAFEIETAIGGTFLNPVGQISYNGISLDLKNDLKYEKVSTFTGRIKLDLPLVLPNIYITAMPLRFAETGSKNVSFQFGNQTFTAGVPFTSSLKLDHYDATLFYGIPFIETATAEKLKVQVGLNLRLIDFKAEINQTQTGLSESKSLVVPVPQAYLFLEIAPIEKIKISTDLKGIIYGDSRFYDASLLLKYQLLKFFFLGGGYKYENIRVAHNGVRTDFEFGGPALEIGFIF